MGGFFLAENTQNTLKTISKNTGARKRADRIITLQTRKKC